MHGARLHKASRRRRDAMARDPRRDLMGRDRDILLRDRDETRDASVRNRDETETLRILSETRPRRDVSTSRDRDVSTETTSLTVPHLGIKTPLLKMVRAQLIFWAFLLSEVCSFCQRIATSCQDAARLSLRVVRSSTTNRRIFTNSSTPS